MYCIDSNLEVAVTIQMPQSKARIYGRNSSKSLTTYQQKINLASEELAVANPSLLENTATLLKLARAKVNDDGYMYKNERVDLKNLAILKIVTLLASK